MCMVMEESMGVEGNMCETHRQISCVFCAVLKENILCLIGRGL